jgi:hypothetical protein
MTLLPPGVKVHLAFGYTDMRKGIDGLAMLVQGVLRQDPFSGHLFVFRGRKANLIQIVFLGWDWAVPIHQAARARCFSLASECGVDRNTFIDLGAVVDADRWRRLASSGAAVASGHGGMMLRLIDSARCQSMK